MANLNTKVALLETMLSQHSVTCIQTSSPERPSDNISQHASQHSSNVQSTTPDVNTLSPTPGLESHQQGVGTQEIESWEMADEHQYRADNDPRVPDPETTDKEGKGDDGDYKDLRQRLAVAKRLRPGSVQELAIFAKVCMMHCAS
jgi:hypothetical protein